MPLKFFCGINIKFTVMKKDIFKIILLVLILVLTNLVIVSKETVIEKITKNELKKPIDPNWEYVKNRLYSGKGETEYAYKINPLVNNAPILIELQYASQQDSLIINEIIDELKAVIPNRTIDYFKNFAGESFHNLRQTLSGKEDEILINGFSFYKLHFSTIELSFEKSNNTTLFDNIIETILPDGSRIERTNSLRDRGFSKFPDQVWLCLKDSLSKDERKKYIQYANVFFNKNLAKVYAILIIVVIAIAVFILIFSFFQNRTFKYSFLNYFLPLLCIWFHYINLYFIYDYLTKFDSFIGWDQNIVFSLIVAPLFALIGAFLLWLLEKLFIKKDTKLSFLLVQKISFTLLALIKEKDLELIQLKQVNAEAEVKLLQSQINPHFLYNALNSITSLALIDGVKTQKMAYALADLFKYSINSKGNKMTTISDELTMVKNYLNIEGIRFGERLKFKIEVDQSLDNMEIPMFIIQPLIENSVKHGISKIEDKGHISLTIVKTEKGIEISVLDNGPDFPEGLVSGHGLQTVFDLLRLSYGEQASLNWQNTPQKCITITIDNMTKND